MDIRKYWDQFYEKHPFSKGKEPSAFLREQVGRLQTGKVLDIAMGEGQNAVFLAKNGFTVEGLDISQVALDRAKALAYENDVVVATKRIDLDMHLFDLMGYDQVVMMNFRPTLSRYYSEIIRSLKHGGRLLVEGKLISSTEDGKKLPEDNGGYFRSNELLHALQGMIILYYYESDVSEGSVVQCLAEKPTHKDAKKLGAFDVQTKNSKVDESSFHLKAAESLFRK